MTSQQYKQFLQELASRYLRAGELRTKKRRDELATSLRELSAVSRQFRNSRDDSDYHELGDNLAMQLRNAPIDIVFYAMNESGIMDALDDESEVIFSNLRRSAIPKEDIRFLREAGVQHPEMEIEIVIEYSRKHLATSHAEPSAVARDAPMELREAARRASTPQPEGRKKRKVFNGIGKILTGVVAGAGNVLLVSGAILAPNPATAYGAIGSSALAIGSISQGIGDLRGE